MEKSSGGAEDGTPVVGLALGSGSSRGWAHMGVIRALAARGIHPRIICGTSMGALVGASYAAGRLEALTQWALSLRPVDTLKYMTLDLSLGGVVNTEKVDSFLSDRVCGPALEIGNLNLKFACVATDLLTGKEVRIDSGPVHTAVKCSMAYPGLFPAVSREGTWLVDGGLVNPVPVSLCRALGAQVVIAVNLNDSLVGRRFQKPQAPKRADFPLANLLGRTKDPVPTLLDTMAGSLNIMQDWITRTRLAMEPPDILLSPRLSHLGLLEIHRAAEAMEEGRRTVEAAASQLEGLLNQGGRSGELLGL